MLGTHAVAIVSHINVCNIIERILERTIERTGDYFKSYYYGTLFILQQLELSLQK